MADDSRQSLPTGAEKLGEFAESVIRLLTDRLAARAMRGGGTLTSHDMAAVANSVTFDSDMALQRLCESNWAALQAHFEESFYARMRKYPLERLIVARFVHLMPERGEDPLPGHGLSRRVIPAFIQALHQMVGPDLFEEYEDRARKMIETLRTREGHDFTWEQSHNSPVAQVLVNDILIYISRYFTDMAKRRSWMVSFFERSMPDAKTEAERAWIFGDMEFHKLMSALYKDLAEMLFDAEGRRGLEDRYDAGSLAQLESMLASLAQDQKRILAH